MRRSILVALITVVSVAPAWAQSTTLETSICSLAERLPDAVDVELDCFRKDAALCRLLSSYDRPVSRERLLEDCFVAGACAAAEELIDTVNAVRAERRQQEERTEEPNNGGPCTDCNECHIGSGCCCAGQCACMHFFYCNHVATSYCNTLNSGWCPCGYHQPSGTGPCYWMCSCCPGGP